MIDGRTSSKTPSTTALLACALGATLGLGCAYTCVGIARTSFAVVVTGPDGRHLCDATVTAQREGEPIAVVSQPRTDGGAHASPQLQQSCFFVGPSELPGRFVIDVEHPPFQSERREIVVETHPKCGGVEPVTLTVELRR
jgi:hypothetical protein